jgi:hypothetical protein
MTEHMTKKEIEKAQKMLDVMSIEQEILAYQVTQGTYQGKQGISRVTKLSLPRKKALLEELRKEHGPLPMNIPKAVL